MDKISMSHLIILRFFLVQPPKQWLTGKKGEDENTKI